MKLEELWLWCDICRKTVKAYNYEIEEGAWILINPHEHPLRVGICPKTVWITTDVKCEDGPELLNELVEKLKEQKSTFSLVMTLREFLAKVRRRS